MDAFGDKRHLKEEIKRMNHPKIKHIHGYDNRCSGNDCEQANLIVKACNSHDALVEACKEALIVLKSHHILAGIEIKTESLLKEALKLAEEE